MAKVYQIKFTLFFLLCNLCTYCAFAQFTDDKDDRTFFGGLEAGGNFSQVDGDNFAGYHKAGWNVGVILYTKLEDQFAASMELLFAQKGSRAAQSQVPRAASNNSGKLITDYTIKLNYLEVPVLLNYFDRRRSNFGAGFAYAQLVGSREIYKDGQGAVFETEAKLYPFRKFDLSFVLNGNAHLWKGFFLNLRFQYSLIPIRKDYNVITGIRPQFSNVWSTRMVYLF